MSVAGSILGSASSTGPSLPQKGGRGNRQDQAGQGDQAYGGGGQQWSSCRRAHGQCFARRGEVGVAATLEERFVAEPPQRLIGDKAYDSDGPDRELPAAGIEPNRANRPGTGASCGATGGAGRSNGCSPGCITSVAWWSAGSATRKTFPASSTSLVSSSRFDGIYETTSRIVGAGRGIARHGPTFGIFFRSASSAGRPLLGQGSFNHRFDTSSSRAASWSPNSPKYTFSY